MENEINTENFYKAPLDERLYAGFSVQAIMQKTGNWLFAIHSRGFCLSFLFFSWLVRLDVTNAPKAA